MKRPVVWAVVAVVALAAIIYVVRRENGPSDVPHEDLVIGTLAVREGLPSPEAAPLVRDVCWTTGREVRAHLLLQVTDGTPAPASGDRTATFAVTAYLLREDAPSTTLAAAKTTFGYHASPTVERGLWWPDQLGHAPSEGPLDPIELRFPAPEQGATILFVQEATMDEAAAPGSDATSNGHATHFGRIAATAVRLACPEPPREGTAALICDLSGLQAPDDPEAAVQVARLCTCDAKSAQDYRVWKDELAAIVARWDAAATGWEPVPGCLSPEARPPAPGAA